MADKTQDYNLTIIGVPGAIKIFLDGQEMQGITRAELLFKPQQPPAVVLTLLPSAVNIQSLTDDLKLKLEKIE